MPANPNTAFSALTPFTAAQANRFPRGLMGDASSTSTYTLTATVADIPGMSVTFTAASGRLYRGNYACQNALPGAVTSRMRMDWDLDGVVICRTYGGMLNQGYPMFASILFQPSAGSRTLKLRALYDIGAASTLFADATSPMRIWIEDMGPF